MKNLPLKIAGVISFLTALIHTFGGQKDLIDPLQESNMSYQSTMEIIGTWHLVTILLFGTAFFLLKFGFRGYGRSNHNLLRAIGWIYIAGSVPYIAVSFKYGLLAPQFILLLPIGILIHWNLKYYKTI